MRVPGWALPQHSCSDPALRHTPTSVTTRVAPNRGMPGPLVKGAVGQGGLIAANNPNGVLATDGSGIDHAFAAYGEEIFGSYAACVGGP